MAGVPVAVVRRPIFPSWHGQHVTCTMSSTRPSSPPSQEVDRASLIEKTRAFLLSPTVRYENGAAKRRFLQEKGLTSEEIDALIGELVNTF